MLKMIAKGVLREKRGLLCRALRFMTRQLEDKVENHQQNDRSDDSPNESGNSGGMLGVAGAHPMRDPAAKQGADYADNDIRENAHLRIISYDDARDPACDASENYPEQKIHKN
jgi:hypothetical protein